MGILFRFKEKNMDWKSYSSQITLSETKYNEGLKEYFLKIYNYMIGGLILTALTGFVVHTNEMLKEIVYSMGVIISLAPIVMVFAIALKIEKMNNTQLQMCFWTFCTLMGLSTSIIADIYTGSSITRVFLITAAMYASISIYGYSTKKDLSSIGSFMFMGLVGIIIASIVNIFLHSSALEFALSILSVIVFAGLTAFETQKIKQTYLAKEHNEKLAIMSALNLYMNFINMFMSLLRLFGERK